MAVGLLPDELKDLLVMADLDLTKTEDRLRVAGRALEEETGDLAEIRRANHEDSVAWTRKMRWIIDTLLNDLNDRANEHFAREVGIRLDAPLPLKERLKAIRKGKDEIAQIIRESLEAADQMLQDAKATNKALEEGHENRHLDR